MEQFYLNMESIIVAMSVICQSITNVTMVENLGNTKIPSGQYGQMDMCSVRGSERERLIHCTMLAAFLRFEAWTSLCQVRYGWRSRPQFGKSTAMMSICWGFVNLRLSLVENLDPSKSFSLVGKARMKISFNFGGATRWMVGRAWARKTRDLVMYFSNQTTCEWASFWAFWVLWVHLLLAATCKTFALE